MKRFLIVLLLFYMAIYGEPKKIFLRENKMNGDYVFFGTTRGKFATIVDTITYRDFRYRLTGSTGSEKVTTSIMEFCWGLFNTMDTNDTLIIPLKVYIKVAKGANVRYIVLSSEKETLLHNSSGLFQDTLKFAYTELSLSDNIVLSIRLKCNHSGDTIYMYPPFPTIRRY